MAGPSLRLGPQRVVVVGDVGFVGDVVDADIANYRWRPVFRSFAVALGNTAIILSDGDQHRTRRRIANRSSPAGASTTPRAVCSLRPTSSLTRLPAHPR